MSSDDLMVMRPSEVEALVLAWFGCRGNVWIHGHPGIGKTGLMEYIRDRHKIPMMLHPPGVTMESVDVRGLPLIDKNGFTQWSIPSFWPIDPKWAGIVFLDELSQATMAVQSAYMQAVHSKRIGSVQISPGAVFVAAGNLSGGGSGVGKFVAPLMNRFAHVQMVHDASDWLTWASRAGIHPVVRAYIASNTSALMSYDPTIVQKCFASPRSWQAASNLLLSGISPALERAGVASVVGKGIASGFMTYKNHTGLLPDPDECLSHPESAPVPELGKPYSPAVYCTLAMSLADRMKGTIKGGDTKKAEALGRYVTRWPMGSIAYQSLCIRDGQFHNPKLATARSLEEWMLNNYKTLNGRHSLQGV